MVQGIDGGLKNTDSPLDICRVIWFAEQALLPSTHSWTEAQGEIRQGGGVSMVNISVLLPLLALIAGILILIMPKMLHYIIAIYLILYGIINLGLLR